MTTKMSLLTGAAVGVFLASGFAAQAEAKTAHHKAKRADAAAAARAKEAEEIEYLKAQVASLTERLNDAEASQRQVQAQAAQATAQQAQAQLANEIQTIPTEVRTQVASANPKPRPSWADNTSVNGRMYFDLTHVE